MARFPTFEEYQDKPVKGVQRCNDLLKRDPTNVTILLTKLQLQIVAEDEEAQKTLDTILARPITDLSDISTVEEAAVELQAQKYPAPLSAGSGVAKLWDTAFRSATNLNYKLDLQSLRCTRAIIDHRLADAQQALIQLKALQPKNRVFYMAHAALTQQLSTSKDDLQSKLAMGLARKAVNEKFDDDKKLDCRVPGQIFAMQGALPDIEAVKARRFGESKQVFDALRQSAAVKSGESEQLSNAPSQLAETESKATVDISAGISPKEWFSGEIQQLQTQLRRLLTAACPTTAQLTSYAAKAIQLFKKAAASPSLKTFRPLSEAPFLAISALVKVWHVDNAHSHLLQAAYLADALLQIQPNVHEARVILIYLYSRLGLGRLAYVQWDKLSIREIQYDTFGHTYLSQISILHPHYLTDLDPLRLVTHGLGTYRRLEDKLAETHASVLNHGQTGMTFDLYDLRQCLKLSVTRRLLALEYRRLARVHNKPLTTQTMHLHPRLTDAWLDTKDNRDFAAAFNHGFNLERTLHQQDNVDDWLVLGLASDYIWCTTTGQVPAIKDAAHLLAKLEAAGANTLDHERRPKHMLELLLRELVTSHAHPQSLKTNVQDALKVLCINELTEKTGPLPDHIREAYLDLDVLQILTAFLKHIESKGLLERADVTDLRGQTAAKIKKLQAWCKSRGTVSTQAVKTFLLETDDEVTNEITSMDKDELTKYCTVVAEASTDAWAGAVQYKS